MFPCVWQRFLKSIGAERSFSKDWRKREEMDAALVKTAQEVHQRLTASKRYGYTLTLKIKYRSYETITRSRTRESLIREPEEVLQRSSD